MLWKDHQIPVIDWVGWFTKEYQIKWYVLPTDDKGSSPRYDLLDTEDHKISRKSCSSKLTTITLRRSLLPFSGSAQRSLGNPLNVGRPNR